MSDSECDRAPAGSREEKSTRRSLLRAGAAATAAWTAASLGAEEPERDADSRELYRVRNGRVRQSFVYWCYRPHMDLETCARTAKAMGVGSIELVGPEDWPLLERYGLTCAIAGSHGFAKGFAHPEEHDECIAKLRASIDAAAAAGVERVITFSGFRRGLPIDECQKNMVAGLKKIVGYAEEKKVTLCLEMLNSRVAENMKGHPDYMCDRIEYAAEVCQAIGSERMKILFDIYHVQIMQGDVIRRIREFHPLVAHYHTAGNPGRGEIGETQEINYPGIVKEIVQTGYEGFVGQEFIPTREVYEGLSEAVRLCDV